MRSSPRLRQQRPRLQDITNEIQQDENHHLEHPELLEARLPSVGESYAPLDDFEDDEVYINPLGIPQESPISPDVIHKSHQTRSMMVDVSASSQPQEDAAKLRTSPRQSLSRMSSGRLSTTPRQSQRTYWFRRWGAILAALLVICVPLYRLNRSRTYLNTNNDISHDSVIVEQVQETEKLYIQEDLPHIVEHEVIQSSAQSNILKERLAELEKQIAELTLLKATSSPVTDVAEHDPFEAFESHVQGMIDRALDLYSWDRVGRADYALNSGGGRVVHEFTSPTFRPAEMDEKTPDDQSGWLMTQLGLEWPNEKRMAAEHVIRGPEVAIDGLFPVPFFLLIRTRDVSR